MKTLSINMLDHTKKFIESGGSDLVSALYQFHFENSDPSGVVQALLAYQNPDGGFGHGLEGDFLLPTSSPMNTSVAFQMFCDLELPFTHPMVQKAVNYLLSSYDKAKNKWQTVPPEVNDYPHAPWWHYKEEEGGNEIDTYWGNPAAELVGYLVRYQELVPDKLMNTLYTFTLDYLLEHPPEMEMHEIYCFKRFSSEVRSEDKERVQAKITTLVLNAVETDPEKWHGYVAQPLDFVGSPDEALYSAFQEIIPANLDFWIDTITPEGVWTPSWSWGGYEDAWEKAKKYITGKMAVSRLRILRDFGRIS